MPATAAMDTSLLSGASFRCRPDCGLCCYTTPAVDPAEARRLLQLDPNVSLLEGEEGWRFVESQGDGGACRFLKGTQCRAYPARPFCCQEFPLSVHLGERAQATVVLSCPGVGMAAWGSDPDGDLAASPPEGLTHELEAVEREFARPPSARRLSESSRRWDRFHRRSERLSGWAEPEAIREHLSAGLFRLATAAYPPPAPPASSDGIETLPLVFEREAGIVAISQHRAGWELHGIEETGTRTRSLGVWPAPDRPPPLTTEGKQVLEAYLGYLLRRDFTYWAAAERLRAEPGGSLEEEVRADLGRFGAMVLARAQLLGRFRSGGNPALDAEGVWQGVRATDGEFLDRPTLGWVL